MDSTESVPLKRHVEHRPINTVEAYPKLRSFREYYLGMFLKPRQTYDALMADSRRLKFGTLAVLIPALLYTLFYFMASAAGGAPSTFKPWLAIPTEVYCYFQKASELPNTSAVAPQFSWV